MTKRSVAIFGASGAIGQALCNRFVTMGYDVIAICRNGKSPSEAISKVRWISWDASEASAETLVAICSAQKLDSVVWAQGANCSDDIYTFDLKKHEAIYFANVSYILVALQVLLQHGLMASDARLCIISSIWQNIARQNKLSYCVTKSALHGLVQSLCIDLGPAGLLVNAVLPGALDTPMTRANLTEEQVGRLEGMTPLGKLPGLDDVCNLVSFLCSENNTGITGQFIAADRGFSYARII